MGGRHYVSNHWVTGNRLATPALHADELQMTLFGQVFCDNLNGPACGPLPYVVSFDVNTLSGQQMQSLGQVNGVPSVLDFQAANLQVTNFVEIIGGQRAFIGSTSEQLGFHSSDGDISFRVANLIYDGPSFRPLDAAGFTLSSYLLRFNGFFVGADESGFTPGLANTEGTDELTAGAQFFVTRVSEPGLLSLLLFGLASLALWHRGRYV